MPRQNPCKGRIILGVTGAFGSGKTTVSGILGSFGADIVDADSIAHRCLREDPLVRKKIIRAFGKKILDAHGRIDRKKLARLVFHSRRNVRTLNRILHPAIIRIIKEKIRLSASGTVVLDAPLLLEAGLKGIVHKLIVVTITKARQRTRIAKRDSLKPQEVRERARYQIPQSRKVRVADFIIDNSGTIKETRKQVEKVWRSLAPLRCKAGARDKCADPQVRANCGGKTWKN